VVHTSELHAGGVVLQVVAEHEVVLQAISSTPEQGLSGGMEQRRMEQAQEKQGSSKRHK
jgi:hypothetical protein